MTLTRRTPLAQGTKRLAQGKPLARTTRMPQGKVIARTARAPEGTVRAPQPRRSARKTGAAPEVRATVIARDGGSCVRCGQPASDVHHRKGRGAGGTKGAESAKINGAAWLLTLCGHGGSAAGCHRDVEADLTMGERTGYRIRRNGVDRDAQLVPVLTRAGWVLFDNDGGWARCPAPPGDDARNAA